MQPDCVPGTEAPAGVVSVLERIPSFPAALAEILRTCAGEAPGAGEIACAVAMDEVLAAKVVQAANAVAIAPVHRVENVTEAVARLGAVTVRAVASAHYLGNAFLSAFTRAGLDRQAMWRHNLAVAAAAAGATGLGAERANAYFAGLMHDVGKLVLAAELGHIYGECLEEALRTGEEPTRAEARLLGADHAEIGAEAAQQWNFAPDVVTAIARHHHALGAGLLPSCASHVLVGNRVAHDMGISGLPCTVQAPQVPATTLAVGLGSGIMSRARWALSNELPRIERLVGAGVL